MTFGEGTFLSPEYLFKIDLATQKQLFRAKFELSCILREKKAKRP